MDYDYITITGAKENNLKNINLKIPIGKFTVITGVSGSGKSTIAFDILYAEGQRRYIENFSSYARQFLDRLDEPNVEKIEGLSPAIALKQHKGGGNNPRSLVATTTEIYEYLKVLFARIGKVISPYTGKQVIKHTVSDVIDFLKKKEENKRFLLLSKVNVDSELGIKNQLLFLEEIGYSRIKINEEVVRISQFINEIDKHNFFLTKHIDLVIDRLVIKKDEQFYSKAYSSIELAFSEGLGRIILQDYDTNEEFQFSNFFEENNIAFLEPELPLFNFNSSHGACSNCKGLGIVSGISEKLVIPNTSLSIYDKAIAPWRGVTYEKYLKAFLEVAHKFNFPVHKPYKDLTQNEKKILFKGNEYFKGIDFFFEKLEEKIYKIQNRVMLSRYRGKSICSKCKGSRLRKEATYIKIEGYTLPDLLNLTIEDFIKILNSWNLSDYDNKIAELPLSEIKKRIDLIYNLGLGYLKLARPSDSLSGGEQQRLSLVKCIGSSLVGAMYILDEPSIGLHSIDTQNLIQALKQLKYNGGTVIAVEHDQEIIKSADYIIDIGPWAGYKGGEVIFQGTFNEFKCSQTLTADYIFGKKEIQIPSLNKNTDLYFQIEGARSNNLKDIILKIPLDKFVVISGVSGSGKTTLIKKIIYPALLQALDLSVDGLERGEYSTFTSKLGDYKDVQFIDQNALSKSSRSNPVTYLKIYDEIRKLFASLPISKQLGYTSGYFSFNIDGGRCDTCKGEGIVSVDMQFMPDIVMVCEDCNGTRFKSEILKIKFKDKNIHDILNLTVDEAIIFFEEAYQNLIAKLLTPLKKVGLGYLKLGQSTSTLSGGEAQRIKLASFLKERSKKKTIFIFDEPTTGLHFHDIAILLEAFYELLNQGHSIFCIEHNIDIIKNADYLIEIGPDSGDKGGEIIFKGSPMEIKNIKNSKTRLFI